MESKVASHISGTKRQREDGSQTIDKAKESDANQQAADSNNCNAKVRESSKFKNTQQQVEEMVQQREQKSARESSTKRTRSIKASQLHKLLEEQEYTCALSGVELTPENVSCDHVIALEKGGRHDISNLQLVHRTVNRMKTTMLQDEFVSWCRLVSESHGSLFEEANS